MTTRYAGLITLLGMFLSVSTLGQPTIQWSGIEHMDLGMYGSLSACLAAGYTPTTCPISGIARRDQRVTFSYGQIVVAGDFYMSPKDLYEDRTFGTVNLIKCAGSEASSTRLDCQAKSLPALIHYAEVVTQNYDHFGWNNMVAYVANHKMALELAHQSFVARTLHPDLSRSLWTQALIANGFADHYLTDAFASGHIRVPRLQLKRWAQHNLKGWWPSLRGDLLAMVLHDFESLNLHTEVEEGMPVQNALGHFWRTRGDGHLYLKESMGDPTSTIPLRALKESLLEVLRTYQTGERPDGIYKATWYVPFSQDQDLADKFSPSTRNALYRATPSYARLLLKKKDIAMMLANWGVILSAFQQDVRRSLQSDPDLSKHLPPEYIQAYLNVK